MQEIVLLAISATDIGDKQVFHTGISMVGKGPNHYYCGHCGHNMMRHMDLDAMEIELVYQCGKCESYNLRPPKD